MLENALAKNCPGALTASPNHNCVRNKMDIRIAVTCGMGGIGNEGEGNLSGSSSVEQLPVILIATSPKDMLLRKETFSWLKHHGVKIAGCRNMESHQAIFLRVKQSLWTVFFLSL